MSDGAGQDRPRDKRKGETRYIAKAKHWTKENAEQHAAMGFHAGWKTCALQLEALARTL